VTGKNNRSVTRTNFLPRSGMPEGRKGVNQPGCHWARPIPAIVEKISAKTKPHTPPDRGGRFVLRFALDIDTIHHENFLSLVVVCAPFPCCRWTPLGGCLSFLYFSLSHHTPCLLVKYSDGGNCCGLGTFLGWSPQRYFG